MINKMLNHILGLIHIQFPEKELETFYEAIVNDSTPAVTINDGYNALEVAHRIIEKLSMNPSNL